MPMNVLSESPVSEISKVVRQVAGGGEPVVVRDGATTAAVISLEEYRRLKELQESVADRERLLLQSWLDKRRGTQWEAAAGALTGLEAVSGKLPVPAATEGEGGAAVLVWSLKNLVVELEFTDDTAHWYARERAAPSGHGGDFQPHAPPAELMQWLDRVRRA